MNEWGLCATGLCAVGSTEFHVRIWSWTCIQGSKWGKCLWAVLQRLEDWVGIAGSALNWFKSYLKDRKHFVEIGKGASDQIAMTCGVPQGSILGPLLFNLYMLPLGQIIRSYNVSYHKYADDTQIYMSLTAGEHGPVDTLCHCIEQISVWMQNNFLQLNSDKTEIIVCGPQKQRESVISHLETLSLKPNNQVRNLGEFTSLHNFEKHCFVRLLFLDYNSP